MEGGVATQLLDRAKADLLALASRAALVPFYEQAVEALSQSQDDVHRLTAAMHGDEAEDLACGDSTWPALLDALATAGETLGLAVEAAAAAARNPRAVPLHEVATKVVSARTRVGRLLGRLLADHLTSRLLQSNGVDMERLVANYDFLWSAQSALTRAQSNQSGAVRTKIVALAAAIDEHVRTIDAQVARLRVEARHRAGIGMLTAPLPWPRPPELALLPGESPALVRERHRLENVVDGAQDLAGRTYRNFCEYYTPSEVARLCAAGVVTEHWVRRQIRESHTVGQFLKQVREGERPVQEVREALFSLAALLVYNVRVVALDREFATKLNFEFIKQTDLLADESLKQYSVCVQRLLSVAPL